ncbi:MAG: hypothetical protein IJV94_01370 [Bacilli bacterium]|nr:hypothetical protein [Bacilli bacterium]
MKYSDLKLRSSLRFSETLLTRISEVSSLTKEEKVERKLEIKDLVEDIKAEYKYDLLPKLQNKIKEELGELKINTEKALAEIEKTRVESIEAIKANLDPTSKEYEDSIKGAEIVAKRARIKEHNNYDLLEKDIKLQKLDFYNDYSNILKVVTGKRRVVQDSINTMIIEQKATLNLKRTLTNKATYTGLVPLFMLIAVIIAFYISNAITGYKGNLTDVINNGVFVAVVATGAVYIYSSGSFDMSLGPASLMCATIAAIVYNSTGNVALACILSIALGAVLGIVNAVLANVLDLPVMVMTLTMLNILNSVHAVILKTQGNELAVKPGMPGHTIVYATFLVCFFLLLWAIFNYTKMGRRNKFIGSNSMAAKYSGVSLMKTGIISFAISGVGLGIAGFLFASYKSGSSFSTGTILDTIGLNVVIAIVFGGMTTSGGPRSKVSCAVIGAFFCIFLDELFRSCGAADYRFLAKGIIFLIVSFANMYSTRPKMLAR